MSTRDRIAICALCLAMMTLGGCVRTITLAELNELQVQQLGWSVMPSWYYCGSDESFDYFAQENLFHTSNVRYERFRIRRFENAVNARFAQTNDFQAWRPMSLIPPWAEGESDGPDPIDFWEPLGVEQLAPLSVEAEKTHAR